MPSSLLLFGLSLPWYPWRKTIWGGITEPFRRTRAASVRDESVSSFFNRRFGPWITNNLVSAFAHGIYASDISKLSMRSTLFSSLWRLEKNSGSIIIGSIISLFRRPSVREKRDEEIINNLSAQVPKDMLEKFLSSRVYSFRDGLGTLEKRLRDSLNRHKNVSILTGVAVNELRRQNNKIILNYNNQEQSFDNVVVSTPPSSLTKMISKEAHMQLSNLLSSISYSSVAVINFGYENTQDQDLTSVQGFGYLLPNSLTKEENPHDVLGVVFDSQTIRGQDKKPFAKLTVIMKAIDEKTESVYISEALEAIKSQIGIKKAPTNIKCNIQRNCIPIYGVGHSDLLSNIEKELNEVYEGRVAVAGATYHGVGVSDCIMGGRRVASQILKTEKCSGLEEYPCKND